VGLPLLEPALGPPGRIHSRRVLLRSTDLRTITLGYVWGTEPDEAPGVLPFGSHAKRDLEDSLVSRLGCCSNIMKGGTRMVAALYEYFSRDSETSQAF